MSGISRSIRFLFLAGTVLTATTAHAAGLSLPALQMAELPSPAELRAEMDAQLEAQVEMQGDAPLFPPITDESGAEAEEDNRLFSFEEPLVDNSGPSIFSTLPESATPAPPPAPPPPAGAAAEVDTSVMPAPSAQSGQDSIEFLDIFDMPADPLPEPVTRVEPELPDLPAQEPVKAEPAPRTAKPAAVPEMRLPRHYRLPQKIYRKDYNNDNIHLPVARYEHEYDAQMFLAIGNDRVETVRSLLNTGRSLEMRNADGDTPLLYAIRTGAQNSVRMLLGRGANPNAANDRGISALHYAMLGNSPQMVGALLEMGADPNLPDMQGVTPLMLAASAENPLFTQMLIRGQAEVGLSSYDGRSPLHVAAEYGNASAAALLVQSGADVNAAKLRGYTPLMSAAAAGSAQVVTVLLNAGADTRATDSLGRTAVDIARAYRHNGLADRIMTAAIRQSQSIGPVAQDSSPAPLGNW